MTAWWNMAYLQLLFVSLLTIDLSKGECRDDLVVKEVDLTLVIPVIETKNPKDMIECTWERFCLTTKDTKDTKDVCGVLHRCFEDTPRAHGFQNIMDKCRGESVRNISDYNLRCLTARVKKFSPEVAGCDDYETVCLLHRSVFPDQTTTASPLTTTVQPTTTTNVIIETNGTFDKHSIVNSTADVLNVTSLLSLVFNFVLLSVCLFLCYQRRRDLKNTHGIVETDAQEMAERESPQPHADSNCVESENLLEDSCSESKGPKKKMTDDPPVKNGALH